MMEERHEWTVMVTEEEKKALQHLINEMRKQPAMSSRDDDEYKHFLRLPKQRNIYGTCVRYYNNIYLVGRDISHKQRMLHWAAVYDAISAHSGVQLDEQGNRVFYGPEYDRFLTQYCKIPYNESDTPRGRYRQVGDTFLRFSGLNDSDAPSQCDAAMLQAYQSYRQNMFRIMEPEDKGISYKAARVPRKF